MTKLCTLLTISCFIVTVASGCGGEGKPATTVAFGIAHSMRGLEGDNDDDEVESTTTGVEPLGDKDGDNDNDVADNAGKLYFDKDDAAISSFGVAADTSVRRSLVGVVGRYYEAAAEADGEIACRLIYPGFARAIPEDYGQSPGPSYLRGAKTCPAVMSLLFGHERRRLRAAFEVTSVRIRGEEALVLLGSKVVPASVVTLRLWRGVWRVDELMGLPLP